MCNYSGRLNFRLLLFPRLRKVTIGVRTCVRYLEVDPFGPITPTPQRHRLLVYLVSQNHWNDVVCLHYSLSFCQQSTPINCEQYFFLVSRHYPSIQWSRDTRAFNPNWRAVAMRRRSIAQSVAPSAERKLPEMVCLRFITRISRSARVFVAGTLRWWRTTRVSSRSACTRRSRLCRSEKFITPCISWHTSPTITYLLVGIRLFQNSAKYVSIEQMSVWHLQLYILRLDWKRDNQWHK